MPTGGKFLFERSYPYLETDHYSLGAVTCSSRDTVYVTSDCSVLRMSVEGELLSVIPTTIDPFHITVATDDSKLYIYGRNDSVEICAL